MSHSKSITFFSFYLSLAVFCLSFVPDPLVGFPNLLSCELNTCSACVQT